MKLNRSPTNEETATGSRDAILDKLQFAIEEIYAEITSNNPDSTDQERLQLQRYHQLGYLANQYRKLKRDTDIDSMAQELDILKDDFAGGGR